MLVVSVHGMSMAFSNRCHVRKGTFGLRKALSLGGFMEHRRLGLGRLHDAPGRAAAKPLTGAGKAKKTTGVPSGND